MPSKVSGDLVLSGEHLPGCIKPTRAPWPPSTAGEGTEPKTAKLALAGVRAKRTPRERMASLSHLC